MSIPKQDTTMQKMNFRDSDAPLIDADSFLFTKFDDIFLFSEKWFPHTSWNIDGQKYFRFMDRILIPGKTNNLTHGQITTLNRVRNQILFENSHLKYHSYVHGVFSGLAGLRNGSEYLEIGPGFKPICNDNEKRGLFLDIDSESGNFLNEKGLSVIGESELPNLESRSIDAIYSCFTFHFDISDHLLSQIAKILSPSGIVIYNVNSVHADVQLSAATRLSQFGLSSIVVNIGKPLKKNDFLYVFSHTENSSALKNYAQIANTIIDRGIEWLPN